MAISIQSVRTRGINDRVSRKICGAAGDIALIGSEEVVLKPINKSPRMVLKFLIENGVTVQACPLYLPNKGISAEDLIDGVTQARPPLVA